LKAKKRGEKRRGREEEQGSWGAEEKGSREREGAEELRIV
jgi:hypothetical protein